MKKLFLFSALVSLAIFTACKKEAVENDFVPVIQDQSLSDPKYDEHDCNNDVANKTLVSDFTIDHETGQVFESEELLLTNKSENAVLYEWDFGNGDKSALAAPVYKYKMHGNYTVTLKATDAFGNTEESTGTIEVLCVFGGGVHEEF